MKIQKQNTIQTHTHIYIDHINIRLYERGRATKLNKQQDKNEWTNQRKKRRKTIYKNYDDDGTTNLHTK